YPPSFRVSPVTRGKRFAVFHPTPNQSGSGHAREWTCRAAQDFTGLARSIWPGRPHRLGNRLQPRFVGRITQSLSTCVLRTSRSNSRTSAHQANRITSPDTRNTKTCCRAGHAREQPAVPRNSRPWPFPHGPANALPWVPASIAFFEIA